MLLLAFLVGLSPPHDLSSENSLLVSSAFNIACNCLIIADQI